MADHPAAEEILEEFGFEDGDECPSSPHGWHERNVDCHADFIRCFWCKRNIEGD